MLSVIVGHAGALRGLIGKHGAVRCAGPLLSRFASLRRRSRSRRLWSRTQRRLSCDVRTSITPSPRPEDRKMMPAVSSAHLIARVRPDWSRADFRRFRAVKATTCRRASPASKPRSADAARTWREVIIRDHLQRRHGIHQENDFSTRGTTPARRSYATFLNSMRISFTYNR